MTQPPPPASARPQPYQPASPAAGARLAQIGFVLAIVAAGIGAVQQVVAVFIPMIAMQYQYSSLQISGIFGAFTFLHVAVAIGALTFGVLGAQRGGAPVRAGIAIGIGGLGVIGGLIALVAIPLVGLAL